MSKILLSLICFISIGAMAQNFQLGRAVIGGSGCPSGSASVAVSPDRSSISIIYDHFSIQARAGTSAAQSNCAVRIPVSVTAGYMIDATSLEYRGFVSLPDRGSANIITKGPTIIAARGYVNLPTVSISGETTDLFYFRQAVAQSAPGIKKRPKGGQEINFDTSLVLSYRPVNPRFGPRTFPVDAELTMDSTDIGDGGITLGVTLRKCAL